MDAALNRAVDLPVERRTVSRRAVVSAGPRTMAARPVTAKARVRVPDVSRPDFARPFLRQVEHL